MSPLYDSLGLSGKDTKPKVFLIVMMLMVAMRVMVMMMMRMIMMVMMMVMVKAVILNTLAISRQRGEQSYLAQLPPSPPAIRLSVSNSHNF